MANLTVSRRFGATAEQVFDAWLDPPIARRFVFATETGEMILAEIDARVGGHFTFVDRRPDMGDVRHVGEYREIDRPRRLVFTFGVPQFSDEMTTVTLDIAPHGDSCVLTLTHEGVLEEWLDRTRDGWTTILETQARVLGLSSPSG